MPKIENTNIDVEDWLDGASWTQVKVEIFPNRSMYGDLTRLNEKITAAEARVAHAQADINRGARTHTEETLGGAQVTTTAAAAVGDEVLGAVSAPAPSDELTAAQAELDALVAEAEALYAEYDAAKEIWTLQALDHDVVREVVAKHLTTDEPVREADEDLPTWHARVGEFVAAVNAAKPLVDEECLSMAVVSVNVAGVDKPKPSVAGIRRLRKRPHGKEHFAELLTAFEAITMQEVDIPTPHRQGA